MAQSALIVTVQEAEPVVGQLRERLDPAAREGVAPHVTILFPFADPREITAKTLSLVKTAITGFSPFSFELTEVSRFPDTLYLAPDPAEPFISLTRAVAAAFPQFPPYGGQFSDIVPHLTVAHGDLRELGAAHSELAVKLSEHDRLRSTCTTLDLIENSSGRWRLAHQFPLAAP